MPHDLRISSPASEDFVPFLGENGGRDAIGRVIGPLIVVSGGTACSQRYDASEAVAANRGLLPEVF